MPADLTALPAVLSPQNLYRFDPMRKPDSRFQRVLELINHRPRPLRCKVWDDQFVRDMRKFLLGRRAGNERQRKRLAAQFPGLAQAFEVHEQADAAIRLHIECAILAGLSDTQIANRLGLTPEAVAAYESLFFAVRDRLGCLEWIRAAVLDSRRIKAMPEFERLMKAHAFAAGPDGAETLLTGSPARLDQFRRVGEMADKFNAALANEFTATQKAELARYLQTEQRAERTATATRNAITAAARQAFVTVEDID